MFDTLFNICFKRNKTILSSESIFYPSTLKKKRKKRGYATNGIEYRGMSIVMLAYCFISNLLLPSLKNGSTDYQTKF
jgi:hypothetical protein